MASSGRGNSFHQDMVQCPRYGWHKHVQHIVKKGQPPVAPHVGTACHAFFEHTFAGFDANVSATVVKANAFVCFERVLAEGADEMDQTELEARAGKARRDILPIWFDLQWAKLESKVEVTVATEVDFEFYLPIDARVAGFAAPICLGPLCTMGTHDPRWDQHRKVCLRRVTGRIDRVLQRRDPFAPAVETLGLTIQDFKTTSARSLKTYVADYLRSDQHLIYAMGWNRARQYGGHITLQAKSGKAIIVDRQQESLTQLMPNLREPLASEILYSMIRVDPTISRVSASDFHDEPRLINEVQLDDLYRRLCMQRARWTRDWHANEYEWPQNTAPSGPCMKFNHRCEYWDLCEAPDERATNIGPEDDAAFDYYVDASAPSPV